MAQLLAGLFAGAGGGGANNAGQPAILGPTDINGELVVTGNTFVYSGNLAISNTNEARSDIQMYAGTSGLPGPLVTPILNISFGTAPGRAVPSLQIVRSDAVNAFVPTSTILIVTPTQEQGAENVIDLNGDVRVNGMVAGVNALRYDGPYNLNTVNRNLSLNFLGGCLYIIGSPDVTQIGYCKVYLRIPVAMIKRGIPVLKLISNNAVQQQVIELYNLVNQHVATVSVVGLQTVDVIYNPDTATGFFAVYTPYSATSDCNPQPDPGPP